MRRQAASAILLGILLASTSLGYYHFVHYASRFGPFTAIPEKFDLNALPNRTILYHISDVGPQLASNDSFPSIVSQIRGAARMWNTVESSEARLGFGGLFSPGTPQNAPGIDIVFDELPPGVWGMGGPTIRGDVNVGSAGSFVPIVRSAVIIKRDLTQRQSFSEGFFLTAVHELGHALGLQHTFTSSVMSTEVTRGSTKAKALAPDDIAGISLLYPTGGYLQSTGVITGRVTFQGGGDGVGMASVVALTASGGAISALTHPDGSYRIEGVPPGDYYVYVHPLPPGADIIAPSDLLGTSIPASGLFETVFYPGSREANQTIAVRSGSSTDGINFSVQRRGNLSLYRVETYSFPGQVAVKPAHLSRTSFNPFLVASGVGLTANNAPARGLEARVIGGLFGLAAGGLRPYAPSPASFVQMDFQLNPYSPNSAYHLAFTLNNDMYVLPSALRVVDRQPPLITSVTPAFDASGARAVSVTGTNLFADTQILFDGIAAPVRSFDEGAGRMIVSVPPAAAGHRAAVVALNSDGQSSLFLQGSNPSSYSYDPGDSAFVTVNPSSLAAGTEAMVEVNGVNTSFADGSVALGFGSSDITVRRLWVVSPTRVLANVYVSPAANTGLTMFTVASGLNVMWQPFAFQTLPSNPRQLVVTPPQAGLQPGSTATLTVSNLAAGGLTIAINGVSATVLSTGGNQVTFQVPSGLPAGPAVLRLQAGADSAPPIVVSIDPPSPAISGVFAGFVASPISTAASIDANRPARPGDLLTLVVSNLGDPAPPPGRVQIQVGGIDHTAMAVSPNSQPNIYHIQLFLSANVPTGSAVPVTVSVDGRTSAPYAIAIR